MYGEDVKLVSEGACSCDCSYRSSNIFREYGSDLEPGNGEAAKSRVPLLLDLPVNAKKLDSLWRWTVTTEGKTNSLLGLDRVQRPPEKVQSRRNLPGRLHRWDLLQVRSQIKSVESIAHRSTVSKAEDYELNPFSRRGGGNCGGYWSFKNVLTFRL